MAGDRRQYPRLLVDSKVVVSLGKCKIGLLYDLSPGGLSVHGILPSNRGDFNFVAFELPKDEQLIVARTEITWTSDSANRTGLRFVQLGDESKPRLWNWLGILPPLSERL